MSGSEAADAGKLRWRCRRGLRELDELLTNYLTEQFPGAAPAERAAFLQLLDSEDAEIHAYCLLQRQPASPALQDLVARITTRSFAGR
jgi:antitoxin CptB